VNPKKMAYTIPAGPRKQPIASFTFCREALLGEAQYKGILGKRDGRHSLASHYLPRHQKLAALKTRGLQNVFAIASSMKQ